MKKILIILLCGFMVLGITGCDSKKEEKKENTTVNKTNDNDNKKEYTIVDKMQEDASLVCATALERFYTDNQYSYSWDCIKDEYMVVRYKNGDEEKVSDALKNKIITIEDLDKFNIHYYKEEIK